MSCHVMKLTERIKMLADKQALTFAEVERVLNLGRGTIRKWDQNIPSADKLLKVANFLNTTSAWLLTGEDDNEHRTNSLSEEEKLLLQNFRDLTEKEQDEILGRTARLSVKTGSEKISTSQSTKREDMEQTTKSEIG